MTNNPLGRGLESLIPQNKQWRDDQQPASSVPQDSASTFAPKDEPQISAAEAVHPGRHGLPADGQAAKVFEGLSNPAPAAKPVAETVKIAPAEAKYLAPEEKAEKQPKKGDPVYYIEVQKIRPNPDQPRKTFNEEALRELASSIREFGLLQPIVVSKVEKDTESGTEVEYELIAGERRLMASKLLGLETIPAIVRNMRLERERLELAVIENLQRENLNPIEMARAYARLQDEFRLTQREVASRLGKSRETVANTLRLLDLPSPIQEAIEDGQITESHGRLLLTIDDQALQEKLFQDLLANKLTTRDLKEHATAFSKFKEEAKAIKDLPPEIKMAEDRLSSELGAPVAIRDKGGAGKIMITFYSKEELVNLLKRLGAGEDGI